MIEDFFSRLDKYMDYSSLNDNKLTVKASLSIGSLGKQRKGSRGLSSDSIAKILKACPDLDADWLLTGRGEMLKSPLPAVTHHTDEAPQSENQSIALYEFPRTDLVGFFTNLPQPVDRFVIPNMPKCDGAVYMRGETMRPALNGGDIALYKRMNVKMDNILFGNMYLLSFEVDDDEHIVINYIQPSESKDSIKLVNENGYYPPMDIPLSAVKAMAIIKASIRYNTMS